MAYTNHDLHQITAYTKQRFTPTTTYTKSRLTPTTVYTKPRLAPRVHQSTVNHFCSFAAAADAWWFVVVVVAAAAATAAAALLLLLLLLLFGVGLLLAALLPVLVPLLLFGALLVLLLGAAAAGAGSCSTTSCSLDAPRFGRAALVAGQQEKYCTLISSYLYPNLQVHFALPCLLSRKSYQEILEEATRSLRMEPEKRKKSLKSKQRAQFAVRRVKIGPKRKIQKA